MAKCRQVQILFRYATEQTDVWLTVRSLAIWRVLLLVPGWSSCEQISSVTWLMFSSVRAVFGRPLPDFRTVADRRSSTRLQIDFTVPTFQPLTGNLPAIVRYPKPSSRKVWIHILSSYDIFPIIESLKLPLSLQIIQNLLKYTFFICTSTKTKIWRHIDVTSKLELEHSSKITNVHLRNSFLKFAFLPFRHMEK